MADLSNILAALAAQRQGGTPQAAPPPPVPGAPYPPPQYATPPGSAPPYGLPQPIHSGSVDLTNIKPVSSGSVSIADAIAKARGIAAEKGLSYEPGRPPINTSDLRTGSRTYRRSRSPSRSPPRREGYRDAYNPYRDERRGTDRGYNRDRSLSPRGGRYSPGRYRDDRSPGLDRGGEGDSEILPLDKGVVGLIIGRSGENLRRVENTTGARVQFMDGPEVPGPQRHCRISGSRAARTAAKAEIFRIIDDNEVVKRGQDKSRTSQTKVASTKEGDSLQMMVPDRTVGLIIGRGGETIRDLQDRSGCHVNIVGENKSVNGMRPVNLIGSASAQQYARDLILEIVESDQKGISIKDLHREREDSQGKLNDSIVVPGEAVGMIIGKGGESIRDMQNQTGCKINVSPAAGRDIEREIGLIGSRHAIDAAKRAIMEKVDVVRARTQARERESRDDYMDRYPGQQPTYPPAAAGAAQGVAPPPAAGAADPYAAYGGYQNYLQMWYAAMAAQQQGGQGQGEQR
ncbi:uncharacterized protein A1O5_11232 [Cladophialophora psammophila CBS 110553]|uniref:K Homology domain-containing protein n=1 Tax=Cladophialophora psammophila CBS 110553 TaxID=1182543 RepID=W9WL30_9EURO|nr:uncharacterized protein A1O5_11232 [Cladophialophora psammophila CBS 110553]EXJ65705.1 hypothetical protein A1O5_11232 [Cladophialophora psammophila CBS 110553]